MIARTSHVVTPPVLDARGLAAAAWRENVNQQLQDSGVVAAYDQLVKSDFETQARPMKPEEFTQFSHRAQEEHGSLKSFDQMKAMDLDDRPNFVAVHYGSGTIIGEMSDGRSDTFMTRYVNPQVPEFRIDSATVNAQIEGVWVQGEGTPESVKGARYWVDLASHTGLILEFGAEPAKV